MAITILVGVLPNPLHEIDDILSLQLKNITLIINFDNEVKYVGPLGEESGNFTSPSWGFTFLAASISKLKTLQIFLKSECPTTIVWVQLYP